MSMHITAHAVNNYDGWLEDFQNICNESPGFHTDVVKAKYHIAGKLTEQRDGNDACLVICAYPQSNDAVVKDVLKFDGPPFVGGTDMIKNSIIIPPFEPNFQATLVQDDIFDPSPSQDLMVVVLSHGVPSFEKWLEAFNDVNTANLHKQIGVVRSLVGQGSNRDDGTQTCVVVHVFKKSHEDKMRAFCKLDAPPFVGGPDLIQNGVVILPMDVFVMGDVNYQHTY